MWSLNQHAQHHLGTLLETPILVFLYLWNQKLCVCGNTQGFGLTGFADDSETYLTFKTTAPGRETKMRGVAICLLRKLVIKNF